jgi:2-iminobutanoate/2-iminopropanoate deaminase
MTLPASQPTSTRRYSPVRAVSFGSKTLLFLSGATAGSDAPYDTALQTQIVFAKLEALLQKHGAALTDIMKLTVFLTDIREYEEYSAVRDRIFSEVSVPPASTAVEGRLGSPSVRVEIEAIAVVDSSS